MSPHNGAVPAEATIQGEEQNPQKGSNPPETNDAYVKARIQECRIL